MGSVRWKAVSKHATCGTPGTALAIASISAISPGRCSGSRGAIRRSCSSIAAVTSSGSTNRPPPWTTRCPTAAIAPSPGSSSDPLDHQPGGRGLVRGLDGAILTPTAVCIIDDQPGLPQPDPLDATGEDSFDRLGRGEDRELQAG